MPSFTSLRTTVNSFLTDRCIIRKPAASEFNTSSGYSDTTGDEVYEGPCRLQSQGGARVVEAGEAPVSLQGDVLYLPFDTSGIKKNQLVIITDSDAPFNLDRVVRITDVSGTTAYVKCGVEDVQTESP